MLNALKRFLLVWFSPYTVMYVETWWSDEDYELQTGLREVHYSWTFKDALEWTACSLRCEDVEIYRYSELVAVRDAVEEC